MFKNLSLAAFLSFSLLACSGASDAPIHEKAVNIPAPPAPVRAKKVFGYSGSQYTNVINSFELDQSSGILNPTSQPTIASQNLPMTLAVLANKKFLVGINYSSNSFSTYAIDSATGNLTLIAHTPLVGAAAPAWVVSHPNLATAYIAESGTNKISIIDFDADGVASIRSSLAAGAGVTALEINKDGTVLYSVDQNANQIGVYSVDTAGNLTFVAATATPAGAAPNQAVIHPSGKYLYTANWTGGSVSMFSITGTSLSLVQTLSGGTGGIYTVSASPDGKNLYAAKPYANELLPMTINASGELAAEAVSSTVGAVSVSFYKDFSFVVPWANAPLQSIKTHSYDSTFGIGTAMISETATMRGLYQLLLVEIEQ